MKIFIFIIVGFLILIFLNLIISQKYTYIKIVKDKVHCPPEMQQYTQLMPVGSTLIPIIQYRKLPEAFYLILEDEKIQVNKEQFNSFKLNDRVKMSKRKGLFFGSWDKKVVK